MKQIQIKTLAALVGMFILGGIAGWCQGRHYTPVSILHPTTSRALEDHIVERLTYRLNLDTEQVRAVRPIVGPVSVKIVQTQNEMLDKISAILAERDDQISALLNDEQKKKLADLQQQRKKFLGHNN